jgi:hypothetical protein
MSDEKLIARLLYLSRVTRDYDQEDMTSADYADMPVATKEAADRIEALTKERDHWKDVAGREGVCMTCSGPYGAPEPYGCSDCFNTGYCGEHHNTVAALDAKLAKAVELLEEIEVRLKPISGFFFDTFPRREIKAILEKLKGESHE